MNIKVFWYGVIIAQTSLATFCFIEEAYVKGGVAAATVVVAMVSALLQE